LPADPAVRVRGGRLLRSELGVLFRRRRTVALLAALAAIPVLIAVALKLSPPSGPGEGPPFLDQATQNGYFVAVVAITVAIPFFLPLTLSVVAGDAVAGEGSLGTLRYLLVAPAGRTRLLLVKFAGVVTFCLVGPLAVGVVGAGLGAALFGTAPAPTLSGETLGQSQVLLRVALLVLYVWVSLLGLGAVGLFVSTLTDVPIGAMAAVLVTSIAAQILGALPQVDWLHPWLFSYHWLDYGDLLRSPVRWDSLRANALLQAGYVAFFGALAYTRFATKDVLA
jgi:ABC-2 type transport system permease protein